MRFVTRSRPLWAAMLLLAQLALVSACGGGPSGTSQASKRQALSGDAGAAGGSAGPSPGTAQISITPGNDARAVDPSAPVQVSVADGKLAGVTLTDSHGSAIDGTLSPDASTWSNVGHLAVDTSYSVAVEANGAGGLPATRRVTFTTLTPAAQVRVASITPSDAASVGVGQPVSIEFGAPITTTAEKAAVEQGLRVETAPAVTGAWHWFGDERVDYRPQSFWAPGTKVAVHADLNGVKVADGVYGTSNDDISFDVGRSLVATADVDTHRLVVVQDGTTVADFPMTAGKPGLDTWNGTMVVMEKDPDVEMNSETVGLGTAYDIPDVRWAVRLTTSGTFVHAAPWSEGSQGSANVSHGCIGLSTADAHAFYNLVIPGDVVTVVNSAQAVAPDNGYGDWNMSWSDWTAG